MQRRCKRALSLVVSASIVVGLVPTPALAQMMEPTPLLEEVVVDPGDADSGDVDPNEPNQTITEPTDEEAVDPEEAEPAVETQSSEASENNDSAENLSEEPIDDIAVEVQSTTDIGSGLIEATFADDGSLQYATDYTGEPVELPAVHITDTTGPTALIEDTDFEFDHYTDGAYNDLSETPTEPGPYYAVYQGIGSYTGTRRVFFRIIGYDEIAHGDYQVEWINGNVVDYTGEPVSAPAARIYRDGGTQGTIYLTQDEDFEVATYYDADHQELDGAPIQAGTYYVEYRGIGSYQGLRSAEFEVQNTANTGNLGSGAKARFVNQNMSLNTQYTAHADEDSHWLGKFTASQSGLYAFASTGQCDAKAYLYSDEDLEDEIGYNDDWTDKNFRIVCNLTKGQTVYLMVCESEDGELNTTVSVTTADEYDLANANISLIDDTFDPTNFLMYPSVEVTSATNAILVEGTDYELVYYRETDTSYQPITGKPTAVGSYKVVAQAKTGSSYKGQTLPAYFEAMSASDLSTTGTIQLDNAYYYENPDDEDRTPVYLLKGKGTAVEPDMVVTVGDTVLDSSYYTVAYRGNDVEGIATVTVTGKSGFSGSVSKQFKLVSHLSFVNYAADNAATIRAFGASYTCCLTSTDPLEFLANGFQMDPQITFTNGQFDGLEIPAQGRDFEVSFTNAQGVDISAPSAAGTYRLVLTATQSGILSGTIVVPITITGTRSLANDDVYPSLVTPDSYCHSSSINDDDEQTYNIYDSQDFNSDGSVANVAFSLRDGAVTLVENLDYVVEYARDSMLDLLAYTFKGVGSYTGTADAKLYVNAPDSAQESFNFRAATATINGRSTVFVDNNGQLVQPDVRLEGLTYGVDYKFGGFRDANGKTILSAAVGDTVTLVVKGMGTYEGCERTMACKVQRGTGAVDITGRDVVFTVENGVYAVDGDQRVWYLQKSLTPTVSLKVYGSSTLILRENEGFTTTSTTSNGVRNLTLTADGGSIVSGTRKESVQLVDKYDLENLVTRVRFTDASGDETLYIVGKSSGATLAYSGVDYMPVVEFASQYLFLDPDVKLTLSEATRGPVDKISGPGSYTLLVEGTGNWSRSLTIPLMVTQTSSKLDLSKCHLEIGTNTELVNGEARPTVTLTCAGTIIDPTNYTVEYGSNTQAGKRGWVKVTAKAESQFTGIAKANFTVEASAGRVLKNSAYAVFLAEPSGGGYYNTAEETRVYKLGFSATTGPAVMVMRKGEGGTFTPLDASSYSVTYGNLDKDGLGYVKITGKNGYSGTIGANFYVALPARTSIAKATVTLTATSFTYDGKQKNAAVASVVLNGTKLVAGTDYTVTAPKGRISAGTYTFVVTGKGAYKDTAKASFVINKAANTMTASATKKTVSVAYHAKAFKIPSNVTVKNAQGTVTYASAMSTANNKLFTVNKSTGEIAVKKGTSVGSYAIKLKVRAAGNANYNAKTVNVSYTLKITKAKNPIKGKSVKRKASFKKLKEGKVTVACPIKVSGAVGAVKYVKVSGSVRLTINKKTGKIAVKKGTKKGTYSIKIKITAAGNKNYKSGSITATRKVVVA